MRSRILRCWLASCLATAVLFAAAQPLMAEDGDAASDVRQTSVFEMYFLGKAAGAEIDPFGLIQIWVLIIMSVCVMALVIKAIMDNKSENLIPPDTVADLEELLAEKRFREAIERASTDESMFGKVIHASLSEAGNGFGAMERAVEETADLLGSKRIRGLELLNVMGAVGPMIGLFGTVYGMIAAFAAIVEVGGQPKPADLAAGISTALVTTFWGLIVGIPAVAASALVRNRIDGLTVETMIQAELLISQFQPGKKPAPGAAGAASSGASAPGGKASPKPKPASA